MKKNREVTKLTYFQILIYTLWEFSTGIDVNVILFCQFGLNLKLGSDCKCVL